MSVESRDRIDSGLNRTIASSATLLVADIALRLTSGTNVSGIEIYDWQAPFLADDRAPDSTLATHLQSIPDIAWGKQVFVSGGLWSLYQAERGYVIPFSSDGTGPLPYRLAVASTDFSDCVLYVNPESLGPCLGTKPSESEARVVGPLLPPLDQLMFLNLLSRGRGICFHASGIIYDGVAVAFCGTSGAGKSTMAELWRDEPVVVQNDDRLIARPADGGYRCWGTPWYSSARLASPIGAPLAKLYFVEHALENRITPLTPMGAAQRLLARSFPPYYDADGMAYTLDVICGICESIPCATLGFVPDKRVVDLVWRDAFGLAARPNR